MPLPLSFFFFRMEIFGRTCSSISPLRVDDLVKGFLILVLVVEGDEEKCSFLPFLAMDLVEEGTSSSSDAGFVVGSYWISTGGQQRARYL
jgi:hypothetical protein